MTKYLYKRNSIFNFTRLPLHAKARKELVTYSSVSENTTVFIRNNIESTSCFKIPVPERDFFGKNANNSVWHDLLNFIINSRRESEANF